MESLSRGALNLCITEIADREEPNRSTDFAFAHSSEKLGYLQDSPETKRYRTG